MWKYPLALLLLSSSFSAYSEEPTKKWYISKNALICASKEALDEQMEMLAQDIKEFADGCAATNKEYQILMLDYNILSGSKGRILENKLIIWFDNSSVTAR
jgi:hypothetical protein